jgi:hypothetical protein
MARRRRRSTCKYGRVKSGPRKGLCRKQRVTGAARRGSRRRGRSRNPCRGETGVFYRQCMQRVSMARARRLLG